MDNFGKWEPTKSQSHNLHLIAGVGQAIAKYGYVFSVYITDIEKITEWDNKIVENFESAFFGEFTSMARVGRELRFPPPGKLSHHWAWKQLLIA